MSFASSSRWTSRHDDHPRADWRDGHGQVNRGCCVPPGTNSSLRRGCCRAQAAGQGWSSRPRNRGGVSRYHQGWCGGSRGTSPSSTGEAGCALSSGERILHPMVEDEERAFVARARRRGERAVVLDIPLLFETGGDQRVDRVIVVSAPRAVQMHRIRSRRRMNAADIAAVIARQMPDREKRRRADVVIRTGLSRHKSLQALSRVIREVLA